MSVRDFCLLVRSNVSLMVAAAAVFGYLQARPFLEVGLAWTAAGTILLAWACSIWNQAQERDVDALLPRTAHRPLPCGRIGVRRAVALGLLCFAGAEACLHAAGGPPAALAAFAVAGIYNGLYTPLKRISGLALLVGAAAGALPPVLGLLCAGGDVAAPESALLYGVYLLWQVPHFWLRAERDAPAYAAAGLPLPPAQFAGPRYRRLLRLWFHAYAAAVLLLPVFPLLHSPAARALVALLGMLLFTAAGFWLGAEQTAQESEMPARRRSGARKALLLADGCMAAAVLIMTLDSLAAG